MKSKQRGKHKQRLEDNGILVPDKGKDNFVADDWQFLSWVYDRLVFVYHENESYDYMRRFKKILNSMESNN